MICLNKILRKMLLLFFNSFNLKKYSLNNTNNLKYKIIFILNKKLINQIFEKNTINW